MQPSSEWMDDRLEAYVDGDLPADERQAFEVGLRGDPAWQVEVQRARQLQQELRRMPAPACPPEVAVAVADEVQRRARHARRQRWVARLDDVLASLAGLLRPALAAAVLTALVVTAARIGAPAAPAAEPAYTQAEVERAAAQVRWALGYVARAGETTGEAVEKEVLREHVALPVQHALGDVLIEDAPL